METSILFGRILMFLGFPMLLIAIVLLTIKSKRLKNWSVTLGKVVDIKKKKKRMKFVEYIECAPVVQFEGNNATVIEDDGIYLPEELFPFNVGDEVNVLYNPQNNNKFYVIYGKIKTNMYVGEFTLSIVAFAFILMGILFVTGLIH